MKTGIDQAGLVKHSLMLLALITLDSRGGFFGHTNMTEAIKTLVNNEKYIAAFSAWCAQRDDKNGISVERGILQVSYTVRVMLAHIRIKYKAWKKRLQRGKRKAPRGVDSDLHEI